MADLNYDEITHLIMSQKLININTDCYVEYSDVECYMRLYPAKMHIEDRVQHFERWLNGDFS